MLNIPLRHTGDGIDFRNPVNFVTKEFNSNGSAGPIGRIHFQCIPTQPELISGKVDIIAFITNFCQLSQDFIQRAHLSHPKGDHHALIVNRVTQAIQTADRRNHDHISAFEKRRCGTMTQPVNFFVDGGILFDVGICMSNVGFRLVVIVIGNEILNRIIGEEFPELRTKLGSKGLIMGKNQCGAVQLFNNRCHSEGLTGTGYA